MQKTKCIIITNRNSWVSEPIIDILSESISVEIQSVIFFDAKRNIKLVKRRFRQYGIKKFSQKLFFIFRNTFQVNNFNDKSAFKLSYQTVKTKNIPYIISSDLNKTSTINYINSINPDIVFVVSCSQILKKSFLNNKEIKYINFHDSLLPAHKGPSPSFWVLYNQEKITGYTIHEILPKVDSGKILYQDQVKVGKVLSEEDLIKTIVKKASVKIEEVIHTIACNNSLDFNKLDLPSSYESIPSYSKRVELQKILQNES